MVKEGSRDKSILQRGPSAQEAFVGKLNCHKLKVCGLKWSYDNRELASGRNDNRVCNLIWSKNVNELVSTSQNQIILCRYPLARVNQAWTGLPCGVKFEPLDHQIIWHLLAKSYASGFQPNPSTDEFIPTIVKDEGISYIHPQKFP
nr:NAC domain-containing protein 8 [Tanacetum cinerariifolium]